MATNGLSAPGHVCTTFPTPRAMLGMDQKRDAPPCDSSLEKTRANFLSSADLRPASGSSLATGIAPLDKKPEMLSPSSADLASGTEDAASTLSAMPNMQLLAEAAQMNQENSEDDQEEQDADDDRSSTLSEIEGRLMTDGMDNQEGQSEEEDLDQEEDEEEDGEDEGEEDTEAETERLEESPHKLRKQKNVLLALSDQHPDRVGEVGVVAANGDANLPMLSKTSVLVEPGADAPGIVEERIDQASDVSSRSASVGTASRSVSPASLVGRKRKRSMAEESDDEALAASKPRKRAFSGPSYPRAQLGVAKDIKVREGHPNSNGLVDDQEDDIEASDDESEDSASEEPEEEPKDIDKEEQRDASESHVEDGDADEQAPEADAEALVRTEEERESPRSLAPSPGPGKIPADRDSAVLKKKAALDRLGTIEKHFATLRDKFVTATNACSYPS
jgi:hypothetical protein